MEPQLIDNLAPQIINAATAIASGLIGVLAGGWVTFRVQRTNPCKTTPRTDCELSVASRIHGCSFGSLADRSHRSAWFLRGALHGGERLSVCIRSP